MNHVEVEHFCKGVEIAVGYGLLFEFALTYFNEIQTGTDHTTAVNNALYEWDM